MAGYAIIIEGDGESFSAYAPVLPGCAATGRSIPPPTTVATAIAEVTTVP